MREEEEEEEEEEQPCPDRPGEWRRRKCVGNNRDVEIGLI